MDILVVGGGIEDASCGGSVDAVLFRDWLKRRINEVLRAGREAVAVAVKFEGAWADDARPDCLSWGWVLEDMCAAGGIEDESGGEGKLLRVES